MVQKEIDDTNSQYVIDWLLHLERNWLRKFAYIYYWLKNAPREKLMAQIRNMLLIE
jgi:hypothetical protein